MKNPHQKGFGCKCMMDTDLIEQGEGYKACTYEDTMGFPTVCYGYNLKNKNAKSEVKQAGGNYKALIKGGCTTENVCKKLLNMYVERSKNEAI